MPYKTKTEVCDMFKEFFSSVNQSTREEYFTHALQSVAREFILYKKEVSVALADGTSFYALKSTAAAPFYDRNTSTAVSTDDVYKVLKAVIVTASGSMELLQCSIEDLPTNWETSDFGTPKYIVWDVNSSGANGIRLYPAPGETSSPNNGTGLPRVDLYVQRVPATYTEIPDSVPNYEIVLHQMLINYALLVSDARLPLFQQRYNDELTKLKASLFGRLKRNPQRISIKRSYRKA